MTFECKRCLEKKSEYVTIRTVQKPFGAGKRSTARRLLGEAHLCNQCTRDLEDAVHKFFRKFLKEGDQ